MNLPLLILAWVLVAGVASAQNLSIATGQARRAANPDGAGQGGQPAAPSAPSTPPMDPALAATLKNTASLRADFAAICAVADAPAAADQRISLLNNLSAAAQGVKASPANIRKLAGHLVAALAGRKQFSASATLLAQDAHALFNGAHVSAAQQEALLGDVKKLLAAAEVSDDDSAKIIDDLTAIAAETK